MTTPVQRPYYEDVVIPALLRAARRTYGSRIRTALAAVGCDDMPRNGSYVIGAIAREGSQLGQVILELGISKQAAGQLIDTLVARGYLERSPDPDDRRRMRIVLTERGELAATEIAATVAGVERDVVARVGGEHVAHARATLGALIDIGEEEEHERSG